MGWGGIFGVPSSTGDGLKWKQLTELQQLDTIVNESNNRPQLIFKHSTRCNISTMAKQRLERKSDLSERADVWYLDLLQFRSISDAIAERFGVMHESPQAILVMNGEVRHVRAHSAISIASVMEAMG